MTDQDRLIEEAAKVIAGMDWLTSMHLEKARTVLSLFEKEQGQPSDAMVLAALNGEQNIRAVQGGFKPGPDSEALSDWTLPDIARMRAALHAAMSLREGGVR